MPGDDPSDVLTTKHVESLLNTLDQGDKALAKLKVKADNKDIQWFKDEYKELSDEKESITERTVLLSEQVGQIPRKDATYTGLQKRALAYKKRVEESCDVDPFVSYYFGNTKTAGESALLGKIKNELPQASKGNANQALQKVVTGDLKDAGKAGAGVKHASSGVKGVSSCTLFVTVGYAQKGLEQEISVLGVGSHASSGSYEIHWTSISKLKVGQEFAL